MIADIVNKNEIIFINDKSNKIQGLWYIIITTILIIVGIAFFEHIILVSIMSFCISSLFLMSFISRLFISDLIINRGKKKLRYKKLLPFHSQELTFKECLGLIVRTYESNHLGQHGESVDSNTVNVFALLNTGKEEEILTISYPREVLTDKKKLIEGIEGLVSVFEEVGFKIKKEYKRNE